MFITAIFFYDRRPGVLKGGKVEDAGPDMDCYFEFCKSPEGIASNACNNGNVRLFNVNESESLGPYMARYLGAKFYRGMITTDDDRETITFSITRQRSSSSSSSSS